MNHKFEPLNMKEHIKCPSCGKLMIKRTSIPIDNKLEWDWWCNCGMWVRGGILKGISDLTWYKKEWERVNNIKRCRESITVDKER